MSRTAKEPKPTMTFFLLIQQPIINYSLLKTL